MLAIPMAGGALRLVHKGQLAAERRFLVVRCLARGGCDCGASRKSRHWRGRAVGQAFAAATYEEWKADMTRCEKKKASAGVSVDIDEMTPCLRRFSDGLIVQTRFEIVHPEKGDFSNWLFDWTLPEKDGHTVKALYADGDDRVQGLVAYTPIDANTSVFVDTMESAPHNKSRNQSVSGSVPGKEYLGVGAHLIAEAVKVSFEKGYNG